MTDSDRKQHRVPAEHPDARTAADKETPGKDRPGFDLGGSDGEQPGGPTGGTTIPGGPRANVQ